MSEVFPSAVDSTTFTDQRDNQGLHDGPKLLYESNYGHVESLRNATACLFPKAALDFLSDLLGRTPLSNSSGLVPSFLFPPLYV
jgi:hypothetical protein